MDAVDYQRLKNQMCMENDMGGQGCEATCPLAWLCTPEDCSGHEEEAVKAVETYRDRKAAERGEYAKKKRVPWIPAEERLPEPISEWVIVCLKNGAIRMANRFYTGELKEISSFGISQFYQDNPVIAWMPLPEPYEND